MNDKMMTLTFFKLYTMYTKKNQKNYFPIRTHQLVHTKDTSVVLKKYKYWNYKNNDLNFLKKTMDMHTIPLKSHKDLEKEK